MANNPRTPRTREEIKAANDAYLKTKGVTNTPSNQRTEAEIQAAAYNPGRSVYMRQGTIDARRSGRPIGTPGYPPAAWQVGPDVVDRGLYNKPAVGQEQSYTPENRVANPNAGLVNVYDSRALPWEKRNEASAAGAMFLHEGLNRLAGGDVPNAALTMIPGHGYIVDPRRQAPGSPYGLSPMRANQVPAQVTSPAPVAFNQAPVAPGPVGPRLPSLPGQMPSTFGGNRRLALATGALPQAPVALGALGSRDRRPAPYPAEWLPETLEDQVSNTLRAVPGALMAGARNVGKGWSAWRSNVRKKKAAYAQRKKK
jgi:hypothetical protein